MRGRGDLLVAPRRLARSAASMRRIRRRTPEGSNPARSNRPRHTPRLESRHAPSWRLESATPVDISTPPPHTDRMSPALPPKPRTIGPRARIGIVAAKYNEQFADALVDNAVEEIGELMPSTRIDLIRVPGAFEIPVAVSTILTREAPSCVIALGCVIRGSTSHADLITRSVTDALQQLAVEHCVPVIN